MYHYAQKHPDEDWAETFAVWLDPDTHWRRRYREWQVAFAKLEYVDRIVELEGACRGSPSNVRLGLRVPYTDMRETVAEYFDIGDVVDKDLIEYRKDLQDIFVRRPPRSRRSTGASRTHTANAQSAARFIQQHQQILVDRLSRWIGDSDKRLIHRFLRQLQALCTNEHLVVPDSRRTEKLVELTVVATWHVVDGIHRLS